MGKTLKIKRIEKNLSVADIAKLSNISKSYVYKLEKGTKSPSLRVMKKLSLILETSVQDLFF